MTSLLRNHPFGVQAQFEHSLILTFAVPKNHLASMIPSTLELDTFQNQWAFIAVAMVKTTGLRPTGFPKFLGNDFFLIGYRIFTRYTNRQGKKLRGLYILKSETNKRKMELLGNIFTHYNYTTTDIQESHENSVTTIKSIQSNFEVTVSQTAEDPQLPQESPFNTWKEAKKFAGPLPHTFTYNEDDHTMLIIKGIRQNWTPSPVHINNYRMAYLDSLNLKDTVLASAFYMKDIPYQWKKGQIELCP